MIQPVYRNIFETFLEQASNDMANAVCNDLILENTKDNLDLVKAAHRWNVNGNEASYQTEYETWLARYDERNLLGEPEYKKIVTSDSLIFNYLRSQLFT